MDNLLDKILETGGTIAGKYFDWGIATEQNKANEAARKAEELRLQQIYAVSNYPVANVLGVNVPAWAIPAGIAGLVALYVFKKK